ncbi:MAG: hypothetical protein O3A46_03845 [Candidatus Poribacteria bacterium]|nr:hypothetical protein [Candidatus Poribacteria bacterium]
MYHQTIGRFVAVCLVVACASATHGQIAYVDGVRSGPELVVVQPDGTHERRFLIDADTGFLMPHPAWSPSGKEIALDLGGFDADIFSVEIDGGDTRNLTGHPAANWYPSWSPDGSRIAFASNRDGDWMIYVMNADGKRLRRVSDGMRPAWSPVGNRIAYSYGRNVNRTSKGLALLDVTTGKSNKIVPSLDGYDIYASWSADGERLAFTVFDVIERFPLHYYVVDANGRDRRRIMEGVISARTNDAWHAPKWSPDGAAFVITAGTNRDFNTNVFVMNEHGDILHQLTDNDNGKSSPDWYDPARQKRTRRWAIGQSATWGWLKRISTRIATAN